MMCALMLTLTRVDFARRGDDRFDLLPLPGSA